MTNRGGFTIVELLVAIVVLTVGLLAMLGSSALDSRAIMRERNIDNGSVFAARRLELLRINACRHPVDSSETLWKGADSVASNSWHFVATNTPLTTTVDGFQIRLVSSYIKAPVNMRGTTQARIAAAWRSDTIEAGVSCAS